MLAPMLTVDDLLKLVEPYCQGAGLSVSRVSTLLFNDGKRLKTMLERRGDISSRRLQDAFQWFSDNWPPNADWPADVPRPAPAAANLAEAS